MSESVRIFLKAGEEKELQQGFPWVFDNEIETVRQAKASVPYSECTVPDGEIVDVFSKAGAFVSCGVLNKKSRIALRLLGNVHAEEFRVNTKKLISERVRNAVNIRRLLFSETDSYRLIFGEADFIPGLVAERFYSRGKVYIVVQFLSLSCEIFRNEIIDSIKNACSPDAIYERSDASVREKEGLEQRSGWIFNSGDEVIQIEENGIKLEVDIAHGQKTGYFLDQKFNRMQIRKFCKGKRVLDTFTHTGAFGLNAAAGGAREVISCDISEEAVNMVKRNIELNGASSKMTSVCADVFDLLKKYETDGEKFDVIILDPPAFTKSAKMIQKAYGGYKEINLRAMRILNEGGILITCSCSHYFDQEVFYPMLVHAAKDAHRSVQILEKRGAAPDHPVLLGYPQSEYLKCAICRVL